MDIYLIGYMGSGKSTIGRILAEKLERSFIDFDEYIEKHEGLSISEIFDSKGEIYFRKIEMKYLQQLLMDKNMSRVVALGGGTPCYGNNMTALLEAAVKTIYLNVPYKTLSRRLWDSRGNRPLIAAMEDYTALEDYVRKHLFERSYFYNQAQVLFKITDESEEETVNNVVATLF